MKLFKTKALKAFALITLFSFFTITISSCYILFPDKGENSDVVDTDDDSNNQNTTDENNNASKTDEKTTTEEKPVEKKKFTVTFNTDGGTVIDSQIVEEGSTATKPATDPTKTGLVFVGWYKESTFETSFDFNSAINADTTIYANWASESEIVTVTFETNGGSEVAAIKVQKNKTAAAPSSPSRKGYLFKGWYKESTLTNAFSFSTALTENITLYAKWEVEKYPIDVEVSFAENITITCSEPNETQYTLTATSGYTAYAWYVNDTALEVDGNEFVFDTADLPTGVTQNSVYHFMVKAKAIGSTDYNLIAHYTLK